MSAKCGLETMGTHRKRSVVEFAAWIRLMLNTWRMGWPSGVSGLLCISLQKPAVSGLDMMDGVDGIRMDGESGDEGRSK